MILPCNAYKFKHKSFVFHMWLRRCFLLLTVTVCKENSVYCIDKVFIALFQYVGLLVTNENYSVLKGFGNGVTCSVVGIVKFVAVQCCKNGPDVWKLDLFSVNL